LGKGVEAGAENNVLIDTAAGLLRDQILDKAPPGDDGGAENAGEVRVHIGAAAPAIIRGDQPEADFITQHMRRGIDLDVQRPPQGYAHS
jgi:hypothetical protein